MPLEERYRRQLPLSLMSLMGNPKVKIEPAAADNLFNVGMSADPNNPALLIARGLYLMNAGRNPGEIGEIAYKLAQIAPHQRQVQRFLFVYEGWKRCGREHCSPP